MTALHDVVSPVTEEVVASVPSLSIEEVDAAIARSRRAFETWRHVSPGDRARLLRRFAAVVDAHVEELAQLEVRNSGTPIGNARWEAGNVARRARTTTPARRSGSSASRSRSPAASTSRSTSRSASSA